MQIQSLLQSAANSLAPYTDSAKLEAEVLLAYALQKPRSYLYTWPQQTIPASAAKTFADLLQRRLNGEPIAYLLQEKEFWSLNLSVSPAVLIPRADTEILVETTLSLLPEHQTLSVADLGTGSGAIAMALASERPHWQIIAVDKSIEALAVAKANAKRLGLNNIRFVLSDWLEAMGSEKFAAIISNPPYIAAEDPHLDQGDLRYEPKSALVADENGYADLQKIISTAPKHLLPEGYLLLEHGYQQAPTVRQLMQMAGYQAIMHGYDLANIARITYGQLPPPYHPR
jgi:release factor glutamine methyltransferase